MMKNLIQAAAVVMLAAGMWACSSKTETAPAAKDTPYATFGEAKAAQKDPELYNRSIGNNTVYSVAEKDGRYYQIKGTLTGDQRNQLDALEFDDNYENNLSEILKDVPVTEVLDYTDRITSAEDCASYKRQNGTGTNR